MWSSPLCAPPLVQWSHHCGWSLCSLTTARHHLPILSMCDLLLLCFVSVFMCSFFSPAPPPMQWLTTTTCQFWVCTCDLLLICCYEGGARGIWLVRYKQRPMIWSAVLSQGMSSPGRYETSIFSFWQFTQMLLLLSIVDAFIFVFSSKVYQVNTAFENSIDFVFTTLQSKMYLHRIFTNSVKSFSSKCLLGRIFETIFKFPV